MQALHSRVAEFMLVLQILRKRATCWGVNWPEDPLSERQLIPVFGMMSADRIPSAGLEATLILTTPEARKGGQL